MVRSWRTPVRSDGRSSYGQRPRHEGASARGVGRTRARDAVDLICAAQELRDMGKHGPESPVHAELVGDDLAHCGRHGGSRPANVPCHRIVTEVFVLIKKPTATVYDQ